MKYNGKGIRMALHFTQLHTMQGNTEPAFLVSLRKKEQAKATGSSNTVCQLSRPYENSFESA